MRLAQNIMISLMLFIVFIELQIFLLLILWIEYRQWEFIKKLIFTGE